MCDKFATELGDKIGSGMQGTIHASKSNPDNVIKKVIRHNSHADDTRGEFDISRKAGELGVGPKIFAAENCPHKSIADKFIGYMEMEKITGKTIDDDADMEYLPVLTQKLTTLRDNGIKYEDEMNSGNYMIGTTKSHLEPTLWIIDYDGKYTPKNDIPEITEDYARNILTASIAQGKSKKNIKKIVEEQRRLAQERAAKSVADMRAKAEAKANAKRDSQTPTSGGRRRTRKSTRKKRRKATKRRK